jgi:helix-turn-helix protein
MRAYSIDIRERVIENLDQESMSKTAKRFRVSEYFVYRLKQRYKEAGTLAPKPHGGGHGPIVDEGGGEFIRGVLAETHEKPRKLSDNFRSGSRPLFQVQASVKSSCILESIKSGGDDGSHGSGALKDRLIEPSLSTSIGPCGCIGPARLCYRVVTGGV